MKTRLIAVGSIIGVAVLGTVSYLGMMSYLSNRTMDFIHQQVENLNAGHYVHVEITNETRNRFNSTATLTVVSKDDELPMKVGLHVYQGLFSTFIVAMDETGFAPGKVSPLKRLNKNITSASLVMNVRNKAIADGDFRGSSASLMLIGALPGPYSPSITAHYTDDKQLVLGGEILSYKSNLPRGEYYASGPANISFTYDAQWSDRILLAAKEYFSSAAPDKGRALRNELFARLPAIHLDAKDLQEQTSLRAQEVSAGHLVLDITPDQTAAMTRIAGNIANLGWGASRRDFTWDMALDPSVADALLTIAREASADQAMARLTAMLQTSPRLVINEVKVTGSDAEPATVTGQLQVDGKDVSSISEFSRHDITWHLAITGLPDDLARANGISIAKPGQTVTVDVKRGQLLVNGQEVQ